MKEVSELIVSIAGLYIAAVVNSTELAQVSLSDKLPELMPGIIALAAGGITFLIIRHLEKGRKK